MNYTVRHNHTDRTSLLGNLSIHVFLTRNWTQWEDGANQETIPNQILEGNK